MKVSTTVSPPARISESKYENESNPVDGVTVSVSVLLLTPKVSVLVVWIVLDPVAQAKVTHNRRSTKPMTSLLRVIVALLS